jgi:predicted metalloprotease with PDZ domain
MLRTWRFFVAAFAFLFCAAQAPSQRIDYVFTPVMQDGALQAVQVDLTFRGQGDGETGLRLPSAWGGEQELWRSIEGLTLVSGAGMRDGANVHERILTHTPNARIHVRYRIIQDYGGPPPAGRNTYRPVIQPSYFHFIGEATMVTPELHPATPARVRTRNLPRGWSFASDLQHPGLQLGRVWASITVGGDYRVRRAAADSNIRVAIRGDWSFSDEAFTSQVGEIISGHRRFWSDRSSPYLVTVTQTFADTQGHLSMGGTGLDDAFAFFATANVQEARIARTLAHESFHTWIPGRIGGQPEQDEAANYWLTEGFTDFYMGRLLVREGLWTPRQFADNFNEMLAAYAQSPVREAPNTRILADYWNDYSVQQLPYQRGRLLATIWDARLRGNGASLDRVMHEMRARALAGDALTAAEMFPVVMSLEGADVRADIETYAIQGQRILLPEDVFGPCGRVVTRETPVFDRGWNANALQSNGNIITGVDPALPAYAAGMRDGMVLVRRDAGVIGDAETQITYVVRDGDGERAITYYPRGRGTYVRQTFELALPLEDERYARCRAVIGGAN